MDCVRELLMAINNYKDEDLVSKQHLRNLVCLISEQKEIKEGPLVKELLFIASQKMRTFGYNVQNGFTHNPDTSASDISLIADEAVKNIYRSKARHNNVLDKSQQEIISTYQTLPKKKILVSAPTSYGKTFLMREILYLNYERYKTVLLVFPTIALLQENASEMIPFVKEKELDYHIIKSVDSEIDFCQRNIFVFTPERVLQLLATYPDVTIDFFFFDEMYKIDEDYCGDETDEKADDHQEQKTFLDINRGKTFRVALYLLSKQVPEYYLAGPNLKQEYFGLGMKRYIKKNNIHVIEVSFEPTLRITIEAFGSAIKEIQPLQIQEKDQNVYKLDAHVNERISDIIRYIQKMGYGKTLLYCTTPGKANEYAAKLATSLDSKADALIDGRMGLFLQHIRQTYDIENSVNEWSFVKVLEKGFGMHHGKLPKYIQSEVLKQFNIGNFDILFCTSTIVEGVNTTARNMVILNDKKGGEPLTPFDIKNIKGRAGRYYHSFVGRIFYTKKNLLDIEHSSDLILDFATYSNVLLDGVDLDNSDSCDLVEENINAKKARNEKTKEYKLPEDVFLKNRLIPKEQQEQLLQLLIHNDEQFMQFELLINNLNIRDNFLKYNYLGKVLNTFVAAQLLDEVTMKRFAVIGKAYVEHGFRGLLKYEVDYSRKPDARIRISVDRAYSNAFKTLKDVIEHKIPQILSLFESIFICSAKFRGFEVGEFSLSKVKRFYETGVKSAIGEYLIEYGFPLDTIRKLEDTYPILSMNELSAKHFFQTNWKQVERVLDAYERLLFIDAMKALI